MLTRAVVDSNVLVSGFISRKSYPREIDQRWRNGEFVLVTAPGIIEEVARVLRLPRIQQRYRLREFDIQAFILTLRHETDCTAGKLALKDIASDPDDDKIISCAVEGKADFIITGDKGLLQLREYQGIKIINAEAFIGILNER
ncbi:MAG: putative toxin-antitoxin system toxin component, PIN family [Chloroflexota bacterium]